MSTHLVVVARRPEREANVVGASRADRELRPALLFGLMGRDDLAHHLAAWLHDALEPAQHGERKDNGAVLGLFHAGGPKDAEHTSAATAQPSSPCSAREGRRR